MKLTTLKGKAGKARTETFLGREWTVVPVVALVEGVMRPMGSTAGELVPEDVLTAMPEAWNGRPVFIGHPLVNGRPVDGNTPEVLEEFSIGQIFNAAVNADKNLTMEAWIDNERAAVVEGGEDLLKRIAEAD